MVWTDYYGTVPENQTQIIMPSNSITQTLTYNMRLLISDNKINPIAWEVSKVEDTSPLGITYITLKQDLFNPNVDNKELMIADYYKSKVPPLIEEGNLSSGIEVKIKYSSTAAIKVGGSYKIFTAISEDETFNPTLVSWSIEGLNENDYTNLQSPGQIKIKSDKNYNLIGKVFTLNLLYDGVKKDSIQVEVIGL